MSADEMFPHKYALCYTGYKDTRYPRLVAECRKAGLSGVETVWNPPSPFYGKLQSALPSSKWIQRHPNHVPCAMGHYRIVKTAYELGYDNVFVMEDDATFVSKKALDEACSALPDWYEVALFEYFRPGRMDPGAFAESVAAGKVNDRWASVSYVRGMACYAMSRAGMKWFVDVTEACLGPGGKFRVNDQYFNPDRLRGTKVLCATPVVSVQDEGGVSVSGSKDGLYAVSRS